MRAPAALIAVWLCFIARALFYCSVVPMWEGFDEYAHFAMVQRMALGSGLPDFRTAAISRQVAASLELAPVPWIVRDSSRGWLSHDQFWQLPSEERARRSAELRALPAAWASENSSPPLQLWEAQQPPLYYWMAAPVYRIIRGFDLPMQVWILRCLTALMASLAIPCAFFAARNIFSDHRLALGTAVLVASMPELYLSACRVSNEGLAIALGAVIVMLGVSKRVGPLSVALGAALLTKAYFLAFLPWAVFVMFKARRMRWLILCLAICGWWYVRTWLLTGTITGEERDVAAHAISRMSVFAAMLHMPWRRTLDFVGTSYIWLGGWSFLGLRSWMIRGVEALLAIAAAGVAVRIFRRRELMWLSALVACMLAGLAYHAVTGFRSTGDAGTMGYYLYCLVVAEAILMVAGLGRWIALAFLAIEAFGVWIYMLPYYAGLIFHDASGNLPAGHLSEIGRAMFDRLSVNKPGFIHPFALAILYLCATAALAIMAVRLPLKAARRDAKPRA
jgi:hypothetical protein